MKKLLAIATTFGAWFMMGTSTFAMCVWFAPPGRIFEPANNIQVLVSKDGHEQKMIVQPQWAGDVDDFGLIMPFPNKPDIDEAPVHIFTELEDLTNPQFDIGIAVLESAVDLDFKRTSGVNVIETRDVGDFSTTTLSADNSDALKTWLNDNGYEITDEKLAALDNYIGKDSGYFVALKVNPDTVNLERNGRLRGELKPIEFTFRSSNISLPLQLMAGGEARIDLTIYTLSKDQYYIPGAEIQFSRKITAGDLNTTKSLREYSSRGKWLVRNQIQFNPAKVEEDIVLLTTTDSVVVENGASVRLNPDQLDPETGLIESIGGVVQYVDGEDNDNKPSSQKNDSDNTGDSPLLIGAVVILGVSNLVLLNNVLAKRRPKDKTESKKS